MFYKNKLEKQTAISYHEFTETNQTFDFRVLLFQYDLLKYCWYLLSPPMDRSVDRLSLLDTAGKDRVQICCNSWQGAQRVVWRFWYILDVIDGYFPL